MNYELPAMTPNKGIIALMGSGELTATMVEVHKELLVSRADASEAVFLDTPAGFQPNVEQISRKAVEYFRSHVQYPMVVASFKSKEDAGTFEAEQAFRKLRETNYILIGPGSPTYAVRQWRECLIPKIITNRIEQGACLVAASAAALTVGRFTLPVYEIYKVGEGLHWVEGIDILKSFGFNLVVIPHWNNAEGGTHDTRFCFMGKSRFRKLEALLPSDAAILGLDEHTACIIDLAAEEVRIKGLGRIVLRRNGLETVFKRGERFPADVLRGAEDLEARHPTVSALDPARQSEEREEASFWDRIHAIEETFYRGLESDDAKQAASALLELDYAIWKGYQDLESEEVITQAREVLRDLIVFLGAKLVSPPETNIACLKSLVEEVLRLRGRFRRKKQWQEADAIRDSLELAGIVVADTPEGPQWHLKTNAKV